MQTAAHIFSGTAVQKKLNTVLSAGGTKMLALTTKSPRGYDLYLTISRAKTDSGTDRHLVLVTIEDRSPLRDAKAMRSDFVANVSHEIRSPLTAISGFVETLQGPASEDEAARKHFLSLMEKEAARMKNLVADLLSLSQVEVKENRDIKKTVDPEQVLAAAIQSVSPLAIQRGKTLKLEIQGPLSKIPGHYDNLLRVLINLLENGVNYSRDNGVVRLTASLQAPNSHFPKPSLKLCVIDEGEGIPAMEIPRLTERFYRVDKSRSRAVGGTGLGLAIVKHILFRHRGTLVIESEQGKGSTFSVYLPLTNRVISADAGPHT